MNYVDSFIAVAEDCKTDVAKEPVPRGNSRTVAQIQYEMLAEHPFHYTQEDVLFESWFQRQETDGVSASEKAAMREEFFAKDQPCLRTSPLAKTHGWGFVFDGDGKVALCAVESDDYQHHLNSDLKVIPAMRSSRK